MSLFKVNHEFDTVLNPEAVKLCNYLNKVSKKELLYIILAYDSTDGPFRMKPLSERQNLARKKVYGKQVIDPENDKVKKAIEEYKDLIFDVRKETIDRYKENLIRFHRDSLKEDIAFSKLKEVDAARKFLQGRIEELESEISYEEKTEHIVRGDKKLSFIERWQLNKKKRKEQSFD